MSPALANIGGAVIAAATIAAFGYAAYAWWRRDRVWPRAESRHWPILWILLIALLSRIWALGIGSWAAVHRLIAEYPNLSFMELWNRWDAPHYLDVARDGYQITGDPRFFIVFYPLYPWLTRAVAVVFGSEFWAAVMVSNTCFALACVILYRLFSLDMDGDSAGWAVLFLCFSPLSFFMSIPYTESLYLLLSVSFFYAARRGHWLWAGLAGYLAALSRNFGVLLLVPWAVYGIDKLRNKENTGWWGYAACFAMIPAGLFTYLLVNQVVTGDWFTFLVYQKEHWYNQFGFFGANVMHQFDWIIGGNWNDISTVFGPNLVAFIFSLGVLACGIKRVPGAYLAYGFVYLIVAYSPTWLLSGGRYMMVLFPLWGILALTVKTKRARFALLAVLMVLLAYYSFLFARGASVL